MTAMKNRPLPRPPIPPAGDAIPEELRAVPRWVIWGFVDKGKPKPAKVPFSPGTSSGCDYTAPENWQSFTDAYAEAVERGDVGIGFVFSTDDDLVAIDLDNAIDEAGELRPWAAEIVDKLPTWAERSPSGRGLHLIGRADKIFGKVARTIADDPPQAVERYSQDRYLTFTGDVYGDAGVADVRAGMAWLAGRWFPETKKFAAAARACEKRRPDPDLDVELARVCLGLLRPDRAAAGEDWRRVGYALKATGDELLADWMEFSRRWAGFDEAECLDRWNRFRPGQVGLQTLMGMAADDSGNRYSDIRRMATDNLGRSTLTPKATAAVASAAASMPAGEDPGHSGCADLYRPHTLDDVGLARRLAKTIRGRLVYIRERKEWLRFDGRRWAEKAEYAAIEAAKKIHDDLWRELAELEPQHRTNDLVRFVQDTGKKQTIGAMVALAQSEPGINRSHDDFDRHPYLLNVRNGVLDLHTGELRPHDPNLYITQLANVDFHEDARSELWERFIRDVTCGDDEIAEFLQQAFGLALTADITDEVLICHSGGGSNGKSTALEAMAAMLGDYAVTAPQALFTVRRSEGHPTELATLNAKRLAIAIETEANKSLRESLVKSLTGGDTITTRRMREDYWQMRPTWHLHIAYNRAPRLTGTDDGIRRRLRVVPWQASFKDAPDLTIKERLIGEDERSGLLAWCLAGLRRRLATGRLYSPEAVMLATENYIEDEDVLGRFLAECTEPARGSIVEIRSLFGAFKNWMEADGTPPYVQATFTTSSLGREMGRRGYSTMRPDGGPHRKKTVVRDIRVAADYAGVERFHSDDWGAFRD
jgi:putative DNA primase/helicase